MQPILSSPVHDNAGNKGLTGIISNPVIANGVAGLATSATAQATIQRFVLWTLRDTIIEPFGETVVQAYARISALRDELDGTGTQIDQGLVNTDPRFIAVPASYINLIPTDVRGLTFNRSPQQVGPCMPSSFLVHHGTANPTDAPDRCKAEQRSTGF